MNENQQAIEELNEKINRFEEEIKFNSSTICDSKVQIESFGNQMLKITEE